ncbi:MAG: DUF4442 domain-containing protein [Bacteroidota bacterium]
MTTGKQQFLQLVKHPWKFRLFLFSKLPAAFFSGVKVLGMSEQKAIVTVPYKWFSQNPFKSTYFACLAMAAELSTGLLAMMNTYKSNPPVSMLVVNMEANYFKKATGSTAFICEDGKLISDAVNEAILTGESRVVKAKSTGKNKEGELIAEFYITWSFKSKKV